MEAAGRLATGEAAVAEAAEWARQLACSPLPSGNSDAEVNTFISIFESEQVPCVAWSQHLRGD